MEWDAGFPTGSERRKSCQNFFLIIFFLDRPKFLKYIKPEFIASLYEAFKGDVSTSYYGGYILGLSDAGALAERTS